MSIEDKSFKPNGYMPKSFGDAMLLVTFIVSGLIWGIKLEITAYYQRAELAELKELIAVGILPRADERMKDLEREVLRVHADFNAFRRYHDENFIPARQLEPRQ